MVFSDQPWTSQAGRPIPTVRVTVFDAAGNQMRDFSGPVTISLGSNPGNGTLSSATPTIYMTPSLGGVAQWEDLIIDTPANGYTLSVSSPGLTGSTSDPFDVTSGPPPSLAGATGLGFLGAQPSTTRAGGVISPIQVEVLGYGGVRVTGFTGGIWISIDNNPGGGTLSGTRRAVAVNGVATFSDLRIDRPGTGYTLRVTAWPVNFKRTNPFDITP